MSNRAFAMVASLDQWLLSDHENTRVSDDGVVSLHWDQNAPAIRPSPAPPPAAGLTYDNQCRLYHSVPEAGRVERLLWPPPTDPLAATPPGPTPVIVYRHPPILGDFTPAVSEEASWRPGDLAVDLDDRLFVTEPDGSRVSVYDLWSRRLLQHINFGPARLLDIAAHGHRVFVLLDSGELAVLHARGELWRIGLPVAEPRRLTIDPCGAAAILYGGQDSHGSSVAMVSLERASPGKLLAQLQPPVGIVDATDLAYDGDGRLVIARRPGQDFLRFGVSNRGWSEEPPLRARGYDGRGVTCTPEGRIVYWTDHGPRHALEPRLRYRRSGSIVTFALDAQKFDTTWGRLFLDACIPDGTRITVAFSTSDELPDEGEPVIDRNRPLGRSPPEEDDRWERAIESNPMPLVQVGDDLQTVEYPVHRRESGREIAWTDRLIEKGIAGEAERFRTYETPIRAGPGRYLWLRLELTSDTRHTPEIKRIRAEFPSHDTLKRLPEVYSREPEATDFLRRYLAPFDGLLGTLAGRAALRSVLLHPCATPKELLPWLAGFLGLVLDERWPERTKRNAIAEAVPLFRRRGTVGGLGRFIELYTRVPVIIIEHFKLQGVGGALVGEAGEPFSSSVIGGGLRVGGTLGSAARTPLEGTPADVIDAHAHRFTVIVPAALTEEQLEVVAHIVEVHQPAHTVFQICSANAGIRLGIGVHVGLSSVVGRTGGFLPLQVDGSVVGRGIVVGRPVPGMQTGTSRLGIDSVAG